MKKRYCTLGFLLLIGISFYTAPSIAWPQNVDSAREKYESGDFEGALQELQSVLERYRRVVRCQVEQNVLSQNYVCRFELLR